MAIHYDKQGTVARITLDNPPVNVFTPQLHKDFYEILKEFTTDDSVHVAVWTGAGTRSFCAGDDIKTPRFERTTAEMIERQLRPRRDGEPLEYPGWESEVLALTRHKPIVAAVNGHCLGQGFIYLMLLSDIRIAAPNATFGCPEIAYGMGGAGGMMRLQRIMPHTSAMWLLLTGDKFSADEALRHHIVNEVVKADQLLDRANEIAEKIAAHPPLAVRTEMEAYYRGSDMTRTDALAFTSQLYRLQRLAMGPQLPLSSGSKPDDK